jgi:hypothetical protein
MNKEQGTMNKEQGVRKILIFFFWLRYLSAAAGKAFLFLPSIAYSLKRGKGFGIKNTNLQLSTSASVVFFQRN